VATNLFVLECLHKLSLPLAGDADEFVEMDTLIEAAKVLLVFVHNWCSRC
jgi:hypothetical protein